MSSSPKAITTIQNLYGTSTGITSQPTCIITINSTKITATALIIDLVLLLMR